MLLSESLPLAQVILLRSSILPQSLSTYKVVRWFFCLYLKTFSSIFHNFHDEIALFFERQSNHKMIQRLTREGHNGRSWILVHFVVYLYLFVFHAKNDHRSTLHDCKNIYKSKIPIFNSRIENRKLVSEHSKFVDSSPIKELLLVISEQVILYRNSKKS